jgi:hypothetical protein
MSSYRRSGHAFVWVIAATGRNVCGIGVNITALRVHQAMDDCIPAPVSFRI